jgi:hypothetical protein
MALFHGPGLRNPAAKTAVTRSPTMSADKKTAIQGIAYLQSFQQASPLMYCPDRGEFHTLIAVIGVESNRVLVSRTTVVARKDEFAAADLEPDEELRNKQ